MINNMINNIAYNTQQKEFKYRNISKYTYKEDKLLNIYMFMFLYNYIILINICLFLVFYLGK